MTDQELLQLLKLEEGYHRLRLVQYQEDAEYWVVWYQLANGRWCATNAFLATDGMFKGSLQYKLSGVPQYAQPEQALPVCRKLLAL